MPVTVDISTKTGQEKNHMLSNYPTVQIKMDERLKGIVVVARKEGRRRRLVKTRVMLKTNILIGGEDHRVETIE